MAVFRPSPLTYPRDVKCRIQTRQCPFELPKSVAVWCEYKYLGNLQSSHTMEIHPDIFATVFSPQEYDGSQDTRTWLRTIEELCQGLNIPLTQMTEIAVKCTTGQVNLDLTAMFEAKVAESGVWSWADFKEHVIQGEPAMPAQSLACTHQSQ